MSCFTQPERSMASKKLSVVISSSAPVRQRKTTSTLCSVRIFWSHTGSLMSPSCTATLGESAVEGSFDCKRLAFEVGKTSLLFAASKSGTNSEPILPPGAVTKIECSKAMVWFGLVLDSSVLGWEVYEMGRVCGINPALEFLL